MKDTEAVTHTIHGKMEKDRIYAQQIVDRTVAELVQVSIVIEILRLFPSLDRQQTLIFF